MRVRAITLANRASVWFALLLPGLSGIAAAQIVEYTVPTPSSVPFGMASGPDGNLWFTELQTGKIGRISPDGTLAEFYGSGGRPHGIAAGPDGAMWFTESNSGRISRITTDGAVTSFAIPTANGQPNMITAGPDGNLWFTERTGGKIGRITPGGSVAEFVVSSAVDFLGGLGSITVGPDGNLWFTEAVFNANFIGRITTTGQVTKFPVAAPDSYPLGIAPGSDGNLWFTESGTSRIGRMTPSGDVIGEFPTALASSPYFIAAHSDGSLWFTEQFSGKVARISTDGTISEFPIPTPLSSPYGVVSGPDGNIWFTEGYGNKIGRVSPSSVCAPDSGTLCLNSGRFPVTASWRAPSDDRDTQATAVALTPESGYFWFLEPSNIELVVKVLDACFVGGHRWVFIAGLTNLEVTVTVKDVATGQVQTYRNAAGAAFSPVQDTSTFACP